MILDVIIGVTPEKKTIQNSGFTRDLNTRTVYLLKPFGSPKKFSEYHPYSDNRDTSYDG